MKIVVHANSAATQRLRVAILQQHLAARHEAANKAEEEEYPHDQGEGRVVILSPWGEWVSELAVQSCGGARISVSARRPVLTLGGKRGAFADLPWASTRGEVVNALLGALLGAEILQYESAQPWRRISVAGVWLVSVEETSPFVPRHASEGTPTDPFPQTGGKRVLRLARQDWAGEEPEGNCPDCGATVGEDAHRIPPTDGGVGWVCPPCGVERVRGMITSLTREDIEAELATS